MRLGGKKQYWNSSIPTSLTHTNIATCVHMPGLQAELTHPCSHANTDIMAITHASIWIQLQLLLPETSSALKASLMLHTMAVAMGGERQLQRTAAQGAFQGSTETVGTPRAKKTTLSATDVSNMSPGVLAAPWRKRQNRLTATQYPSVALWKATCHRPSFTSLLDLTASWSSLTEPRTKTVSHEESGSPAGPASPPSEPLANTVHPSNLFDFLSR